MATIILARGPGGLPDNPNDPPPAKSITLSYLAPVHIVVEQDESGEWRMAKVVVDDEGTDFSPAAEGLQRRGH